MDLSIMVPHFPALGSGGVPPVPPTILMSASGSITRRVLSTLARDNTGQSQQGHP
jgi:hypothetical protein